MKVLIVTDIHIHIIDEKLYLAKQIYHIIKRYNNAFGDIILYCREKHTPSKEELISVDGVINKHIGFSNICSMIFGNERKELEDIVRQADLVIGRFHSFSACVAAQIARKNKIPFLAEVMGDAWDGYWNHGIVGKIIAPAMFFWTRRAIKNADFGLYVTEHFLQGKYPCDGQCISASNVELVETTKDVLLNRIEKIRTLQKNNIRLMTAANVDVRAKGHEYVIKAIPLLREKGIIVKYDIAGGGDQMYLRRIAKQNNVEDQVHFWGRLQHDEVRTLMDDCDIYIQPSLQEGLPRSVIEAMSRGCLCCGAKTAGIPELLQPECVFKRRSERDIAKVIMRLLNMDMEKIATENFYHSKEYLTVKLNKRRELFFNEIQEIIMHS